MLADQVGDVGDGEEVRRVAEVVDHARARRRAASSIAAAGAGRSGRRPPASQRGRGAPSASAAAASRRSPRRTSSSGKWTSPRPRSARGSRAHRSATAPGARRAAGGPVVASRPARPADLLGDLGHLLAGLEVALGVDPVDVAQVEGDQPAGRVEHVDGRGVAAVGVADGVGEHRGEPASAGEPEHPGGGAVVRGTRPCEPGPGRPRWETTSTRSRSGPSVAPGAEGARARSSAGGAGEAPGRPRRPGPSSTSRSPPAARPGRARRPGRGCATGRAALAAQVGRRDQPAQRRPAGPACRRAAGRGQQGDPRVDGRRRPGSR